MYMHSLTQQTTDNSVRGYREFVVHHQRQQLPKRVQRRAVHEEACVQHCEWGQRAEWMCVHEAVPSFWVLGGHDGIHLFITQDRCPGLEIDPKVTCHKPTKV